MQYVVYSQKRGVTGYHNGFPRDATLREDEIAVPCEQGADLSDKMRWMQDANHMKEHCYIAPSVDLARQVKREDLMRMRDAIIGEGFAYGGRVYPINPDIQSTMHLQFTTSQVIPAPSYSWKDIDGLYRPIGNAEAFQSFIMAALMYGQSLYAWEEMLQTLVNAAESIEDVQSITWDTVPDEPV